MFLKNRSAALILCVFLALSGTAQAALKAVQIELLLAGVRDPTTGLPVSGAKIYTYAAGTTTNKTTWTDRAKTTPAANPIITGSDGKAQIYADGIYKFIIKTSTDTTLYTYDNLAFALAEGPWIDAAEYASLDAAVTAIGATKTDLLINTTVVTTATTTVPANINLRFAAGGLITVNTTVTLTLNSLPIAPPSMKIFDLVGTGAILFGTSVASEIYPNQFGAKGDGVTDDSAAINAAINSAPTPATQGTFGKGNIIRFLDGVYLVGSGIINNGKKVSFVGSGFDVTTLKKNVNMDLIKVDSFFRYQSIRDMTLDGNAKTGAVIYLNTPNNWEIEDVRVINNGGVATTDTDAALYFTQATVGYMKNIMLHNNIRNGFFDRINVFRIHTLEILDGTVYDDMEFLDATDTQIVGVSFSTGTTNGGMAFKGCINVSIKNVYVEHTHSVNVLTVGDTGKPVKGFSLENVNITRAGTTASPKATIFVQLSSLGINIKNVFVTATNTVGAHTGGWIEIAEVKNVLVQNVTAQSMNTVVSAADLIKTSSVGPDYLTIENVYEESTGGVASMTIKADNLRIANSNVNTTITTGSTNVILENYTGTLTDNSTAQVSRINAGFISTFKSVAATDPLVLGAGNVFLVTAGAATVNSIAAADRIAGREVTLILGAAVTFNDTIDLKLAGNFVGTTEGVLVLKCDGSRFYEASRSAN